MRGFLTVLVALCLIGGPAHSRSREDLQAGLEHLKANRCQEARESFTRALSSDWMTPDQRGTVHMLRGLCQMALDDLKAARADLDEAVKLMEDPGTALGMRADLALHMEDREQAYRDVMSIARKHRGALPDVEMRTIWRLLGWLKEEKRGEDRFALLEAVVTAGYAPDEAGLRPDGLIREYIRALIGKGRAKEAAPLVGKITAADTLLEMRVLGDFRPLWSDPEFEARSQPRAAAERDREYWKGEAAKHPKNLTIVSRLMRTLRMLGEFDAAIALGRKVVDNPAAYDDDREDLAWVANELVYAWQDAGRMKEALAAMAPVLARSIEQEPYLVSQFINFSITMMYAGDNERALATGAKAKDRVSPYGRKWIDSTEVCANHALGRTAEAEAALGRLKTKPEENYAALSRALLCLNRTEEAAQLALVRLRSPDHRDSMLMALQNFQPHGNMPALAREMTARWEKVRRHPDVVREAEKHGRLLDIPLYGTYWGDV